MNNILLGDEIKQLEKKIFRIIHVCFDLLVSIPN